MVALSAIQDVADNIARDFHPERIILFGSYARGNPTADSDVDLLVILPFDGKPFWKSLEIMNRVDAPFALDLLAWQPTDTASRYEDGDPLIRDALDNGEVLHKRVHQ
jgi:uncharacterized protein